MTAGDTSFSLHFGELRQRLAVSLLAVLAAGIICYFFAERLTAMLLAPIFKAQPLVTQMIYTKLTEAFIAYLKVSLLSGLLLVYPLLLFHFWRFIAPGLDAKEKKNAFLVVFCGSALFAGGGLFAYFFVLPRLFFFLLSFAGPQLTPLPRLADYLSFTLRILLVFGLAFEIPFLMIMTRKSGIIDADFFRRQRRGFYLGISVLAFLLAAGDLAGTVFMVLPLCGLYEAGSLFSRLLVPADA